MALLPGCIYVYDQQELFLILSINLYFYKL